MIKVGTQLAVANAVTMGLFNSNLQDFFTGNRDGVYRAGSDGASRLTLPELLGVGAIAVGGNYGGHKTYSDFPSTVKENFKQNGPLMMAQMIGIPIAVNVAKKFLAKPVINPANRMLRSVGIKEVKI